MIVNLLQQVNIKNSSDFCQILIRLECANTSPVQSFVIPVHTLYVHTNRTK